MTKTLSKDRLQGFFLNMTQRSFGELGIRDAEVTGYVADVLTEFARSDRLYRMRSRRNQRLDSVVEMLVEDDATVSRENPLMQERRMRKYLGDYTLFMSGVFRSYVERGGYLDYYLQEGRRSYRKVSEVDLSLYRTGFLLFQELSEKFEYLSGALDYMHKAYFAAAPKKDDPFAGFLKQIEGWMKVNVTDN
ncbi:MAG: hypothetical protein OXK20_07945 [Deltaproteobacteria bacterium]|nr:hypothetical protein [Deltaproteobacteria bacterium]